MRACEIKWLGVQGFNCCECSCSAPVHHVVRLRRQALLRRPVADFLEIPARYVGVRLASGVSYEDAKPRESCSRLCLYVHVAAAVHGVGGAGCSPLLVRPAL